MKTVKVIGYIEIDAEDSDSGPLGPLTEDADMRYRRVFQGVGMTDIEFEEDNR